MRTASASSPTSSIPSSSPTIACIVNARTRRPAQRLRRRPRGRLQLLVVELDPHRAQLFGQSRTALRRAVRDEADPVPVGTKPPNGVAPAGDRFARNVEDSVDVQQNCGHGRRVYSRDPFGRSPAGRGAAPLLAFERARRTARAEVRDSRRSGLRRRSPRRADRRPEAASRRPRWARSCGPWRRTSEASSGTASSPSRGSSNSSGGRSRSSGAGCRRSRRRPPAGAGWTTNRGVPGRSGSAATSTTEVRPYPFGPVRRLLLEKNGADLRHPS